MGVILPQPRHPAESAPPANVALHLVRRFSISSGMAELVIRRGLEEPDTSSAFVPHKPLRPDNSAALYQRREYSTANQVVACEAAR